MPRLKIGLFARTGDQQTSLLKGCIDRLDANACCHFTLPQNSTPGVALDETGVYWGETNVAELDCAYIHGFRYANPVIPRSLDDIDWTLWQTDYIAEQQKVSFLYSAFSEMERRGVRLFNSPAVHVQNFMKLDLLETLRQGGFQVPRLVCSNDRKAAEAFVTMITPVIWRPTTGRAAWQLCLDRQRENLISPDKPPILLAEVIEGPLIRAYLFDGKPLLCLKHNAPAPLPLERLEMFQAAEYPEVYEELQRLAELVGLRWVAVFFALREDRPWIYDIDPDPLFEGLPEVYQRRLTEGLARGLLGDDPRALGEWPDTPQLRPTPFLRRMLRILFEFESFKYQRKP